MKAFISLAISMLLVGLLYVYVRQQFALLETHVDELKRVIKLLALPQEEKLVEVKVEKRPSEPELIEVSDDDTDEETDEESDDESEESESKKSEPKDELRPQVAHVMMQGHDLMQLMQQMSFPTYESEPAIEIEELDVSEKESKVVVMEDKGYENMSVKELKDKVQLLGGPSLKTKKQLVEYLEKNVSN